MVSTVNFTALETTKTCSHEHHLINTVTNQYINRKDSAEPSTPVSWNISWFIGLYRINRYTSYTIPLVVELLLKILCRLLIFQTTFSASSLHGYYILYDEIRSGEGEDYYGLVDELKEVGNKRVQQALWSPSRGSLTNLTESFLYHELVMFSEIMDAVLPYFEDQYSIFSFSFVVS